MLHFETNIKIFQHSGQNVFSCTIAVLCNNGTLDPLGVVYLMTQGWRERESEYIRLNSVTVSQYV